jgi:hypothetical protein
MTVPHTSALISLEVNMLSNMQRKCESPNPAASRVRGPDKVPRPGAGWGRDMGAIQAKEDAQEAPKELVRR